MGIVGYKEKFGSYRVSKRPRGERSNGLWEYQLLKPLPKEVVQNELF